MGERVMRSCCSFAVGRGRRGGGGGEVRVLWFGLEDVGGLGFPTFTLSFQPETATPSARLLVIVLFGTLTKSQIPKTPASIPAAQKPFYFPLSPLKPQRPKPSTPIS